MIDQTEYGYAKNTRHENAGNTEYGKTRLYKHVKILCHIIMSRTFSQPLPISL